MKTKVRSELCYLPREIVPCCRLVASLMLLFLSPLFVGCGGGPDLVRVQGKVTLNGESLSNAMVRFCAPNGEGRGAAGRTDDEGRYTLRYNDSLNGIAPGQYKVQITTRNLEGIPGPKNRDLVPSKYNTETELEVQIDSSESHLDFELSS